MRDTFDSFLISLQYPGKENQTEAEEGQARGEE
jgi:hypothetical protein